MASYTITIGEMMNNAFTKNIFPSNYDFYIDDEQARKSFEDKFIKHYYYREIGFETPFMFIQKLESHLLLNMPYWKQLYQTELESRDINFLLNKDLHETFSREIDTENSTAGSNTSTQNSSSTNSITQTGTLTTTNTSSQDTTTANTHKESSISDGVSTSSLTDGYLTATSSDNMTNNNKSTTNSSDENESSGSSSSTGDIEIQGTSSQSGNEKVVEKTDLLSQGNIGITSSAQLLKEWREVLINMDKIIIESCNDLFLKIY